MSKWRIDGAHAWNSPRRLQRCLGSTQFLRVPGTHELEKMCVLLYLCASYTHTCALMGTLCMANVQLALVPTFVLLIPAQSVLQNKSVWINYATKQENGHLYLTSHRQK